MDHNKKHKNSRNLSNNQQQQNSEDVVAQSNNEQQSDAVAGSSSSNHGSVAENSAANVSHAPAVPSTSDGKKGVHATKSCPNDSAFRNPAASFSCNKQPNAQGASHSGHRAISNNTRKNKRYSNMGIDLLSEVPTSKANDGSGAPVPGCSHSAAIPSFQAPALHGLPVAPADAEMEDDDDEEGSGFAHHCPIDQLSHPIGMEVGLVNNAQPLPAVVPAEHDAAAAPENVKEEAPMMVDQLANHEQQQNQEQQHFAPQAEDENEPHVVPYNWQASKTNVKERLAYMFNNEVMADVHFVVGKGHMAQRIPAHRFVLSTGSAVFDAMFYGGMATKSETVDLPDVEPAAFLALLKFLYSDEVQIGPETVMTTLYTAKKYAVPALEKACVDFLKRNLGSDNAFMLLTQARLFDEPQLAALCLETIDKNTSDALAAEGFLDIDLDTLCVVLARDTLGIRECKLFAAVCRWAEAECHRRHVSATADQQRIVLSKALKLVRFPLMTVEEFAMGAAQSKILTDREVVELFLHFTVNPKPSVAFLDVPRCCLTGKEQVVSRFIQIESRWGYSGTSDRIRFMVNRRIFVVGFGLYGSIHGPSEYQVQIQVLHTDTGKVCGHNDTSFQCDGANSTFRVMFKEPVEIQANASYTACATLKGSDSYYGTKGLRKVTHESVTSGKVTFHFSYAAGNNNGTSVEDGQIPEIIFYRYT